MRIFDRSSMGVPKPFDSWRMTHVARWTCLLSSWRRNYQVPKRPVISRQFERQQLFRNKSLGVI